MEEHVLARPSDRVETPLLPRARALDLAASRGMKINENLSKGGSATLHNPELGELVKTAVAAAWVQAS